MKSKSILQKKPELIAVTILAMFLLSGMASAETQMISTHAMGDYLKSEAMYVFTLLLILTFLVGLSFILVGSVKHSTGLKVAGYSAVGAVVIVVVLYFLIPGVIHNMEGISVSAGNTTGNESLL